jgi:hypothetical protein
MKNVSASRVLALVAALFFALLSLLSLLSTIAFLRQQGADYFALTYLAYAALNGAMAYGLYRDRRWVVPIFALNLALALERAIGGASSFTYAAIAANAAALVVVATRRDRWTGPLWSATAVVLFVVAQLLPYLLARPVLQ